MLTQNKPGGAGVTTAGNLPPNPNQFPNQFYGPANFGQPAFGLNYGPSFPYNPYGGAMAPQYAPQYNPYPQPPAFGYNPPFQPPLQTLAPYQPFQSFAQPQPLATPQEFGAYLNSIQQQYNTYVSFVNLCIVLFPLYLIDYSANIKLRFYLFIQNVSNGKISKIDKNYLVEEALHSLRLEQQPLLALILGQLSTKLSMRHFPFFYFFSLHNTQYASTVQFSYCS